MRAVADDHGKPRRNTPATPRRSTPNRPPHLSSLAGLQRAAGNRAVGQLIAGSQRAEPAAQPVVQRGLWDRVKGVASSALQWGMRAVVEPLRRLGASAATAVGGFARKVGEGLATVRPRWGDALNPFQLAMRSAAAVRQRLTADLVAAERRERTAAAAAQGGPAGKDPGPGPIEQADAAARRVEDMTGGSEVADELVEGAVLGDFKENPTVWNTVGQIAVGFVPYAGQVADLRDTIASINKLRKGAWKDPWEWVNLGLTLIGWVPGLGDVVKGLGRGAIRGIRGSGTKLARLAGRAWNAVRHGVPKLLGKAKAVGRRLLSGARSLGGRALAGARALGRGAAAAGRRLLGGARLLGGRAVARAMELVRGARATGGRLLERARGFLGRAVSAIRALAERGFRGASDVVRRGIEAASSGWNRARQVAADLVRTAGQKLTAARRWAAETARKAADAARGLLNRARTAASSAWNRAVAAGRALARRGADRVRRFVTQDIPNLGRRIVNGVKNKVRSMRDGISDFLRRKWEDLKRRLGIKKKFKRSQKELDDLARDPAHNNQISPKSIRERQAGLDLEARGEIPGPITRDPNPAGAEFIDGAGNKWDVKAFNSNFPPKKGGFSVPDAERKIAKELGKGENVILDTQDLSPQHIQQLRQLVASKGWGSRVRWWP